MKMSVAEQELNRCKHFNGIQHECCKKLVRYETFRKPSGALTPLPCFKDGLNGEGCELVEWSTPEEAEAYQKMVDQKVAEYLADIEASRCPICKQQVTKRQVGHCVYGSCGHRMYQGKV